MKKNFQIFLHKKISHKVNADFGNQKKNFVKFLFFPFWVFYEFFFIVGKAVYLGGQYVLGWFKNQMLKTLEILPNRLKALKNKVLYKNLAFFLVLAFVVWFGLEIFSISVAGLELKDSLLKKFILGGKQLTKAGLELQQTKFLEAENRFNSAYLLFEQGKTELNNTKNLLSKAVALLPPGKKASSVVDAVTSVSLAGEEMAKFLNKLSEVTFTPEGIFHPVSLNETLDVAEKHINLSLNHLNDANNNLIKINKLPVSDDLNKVFNEIKHKTLFIKNSTESLKEMYSVFKFLSTAEKRVLLVFQNNNELRATGGFMGSFGAYKLINGKIQSMNISSIYDLDGQLKEKIIPPTPLLNVNNRWFLRDSNWFASFPDSAKKITYFYEKEGGETPDVIIALTPDIVVDLLKITGPIEIKSYNTTLNSENFVELIQVFTSQNNFPENRPKQILADLFPILLEKITLSNNWKEVIAVFQKNLQTKQMVYFFRNEKIQNKIENFNWAGKILETDRDYLHIVNSNLGGTKSDLYIEQNFSLITNINQYGEIINELTVNRINNMPNLPGTHNLSYMRIYVPKNSVLLSTSGFDKKNLEDLKPNDSSFKIDPDVYKWERNAYKNLLSGTTIYEESEKTVFGNWLNINGGENKQVKLTYKLPFKLKNIDRHTLFLQKQIGSKKQLFSYKLNFSNKKVEWSTFSGERIDENSLSYVSYLDKDEFLGLVFTNILH